MGEKDLSEKDPNELFWDFCFEPDGEKAIDIRDELFGRIVSLHTRELPNGGMYYEYLPEDVFVCCEKMRIACEEHTLNLEADTVGPFGHGKCWYSKCPFCDTGLIITKHSISKADNVFGGHLSAACR
jgi:hypothetical protein